MNKELDRPRIAHLMKIGIAAALEYELVKKENGLLISVKK